MSVTIYDVAKQVGVSGSTVARALAGVTKGRHKDIAQRIALIRSTATALGYRKNFRASAFAQKQTRSVAVLISDRQWKADNFSDHLLKGVADELRKQRRQLILTPIDGVGDWESLICCGGVDGCIALHGLSAAVRERLRRARVPCVQLMHQTDPNMPYLDVDFVAGIYLGIRHLAGLGHQRISLFVHPDCAQRKQLTALKQAYEAAMLGQGLEPMPLNRSEGSVVRSLRQTASRRTSAVFCYSEFEARLLAHALWHNGMAMPRDVSAIAFSHNDAAQYMTPPLTSLVFNASLMGSRGVQMLSACIDIDGGQRKGQRLETHVSAKAELIVRGSTAAPKNSCVPAFREVRLQPGPRAAATIASGS